VEEATSSFSTPQSGLGRAGFAIGGRTIFLLVFLLALFPFFISWTLEPSVPPQLQLCHSVTDDAVDPGKVPGLTFQCDGTPANYADRWLWLRHEMTGQQQTWPDWSMNLHNTRFEDLLVNFHFANGHTETHRVRAGDFGNHWTPNGYLAFHAHSRPAPLDAITLGINRLASYELLRLRLVPGVQQDRAVQLTSVLVGASLSLLTVSLVYNLFITVIARKRRAIWHCAWVVCMIAWGLCWSQLILLVAPQLAGSATVRISSVLATSAIVFANQYMLVSLEKTALPRIVRVGLRGSALAMLLLCPAALYAPAGMATILAELFRFSTVLTLTLVIIALIVALYRRSQAAKDFALAWSLPIAAVLASFTADTSTTVPVVSGELMVLGTSALQTLWLSFAASRGFANLQAERDQARAMQSELMVLAETDPLTKLYNRRGMMERFHRELAQAQRNGSSLGLMLVDIDHFKSINDTFGHEVGDHALQHVANLLAQLRKIGAIVARFGGEEFCIIVPGKTGEELLTLAERVRRLLADADMSKVFDTNTHGITASFGIIDTREFPDSDAATLLRAADQALYRAKAGGRNRVVMARREENPPSMALEDTNT